MSAAAKRRAAPDATPVADLGLPGYGRNACFHAGIETVGDIRAKGRQGMKAVPNFGVRSLARLEAAIGSWISPGDRGKPLPRRTGQTVPA